jgi:hypothetical protein
MKSFLWRILVIFHRYLGIAVGILMLIWFASGIVMMYVGFPRLAEQERTSALSPIPWQACCRIANGLIPDDQQFYRVQIENLLGAQVLRLRRPPRPDAMIDLAQGAGIRRFDIADTQAIALDALARITGPAAAVSAAAIDEDQWTVGRYRRDRPLHRFTFDDPDRSTIYVSSTSGQIVLRTTSAQRFWNWLGAIPHWFYLTALRSDGPLWSKTVIWASFLGTFPTVLGLYLGFAQFRRSKDGKLSPYRGLFYWHHLGGLVFGDIRRAVATRRRQCPLAPLAVRRPPPLRFRRLAAGPAGLGHHHDHAHAGWTCGQRHRRLPGGAPHPQRCRHADPAGEGCPPRQCGTGGAVAAK